MDVHDCEEMLYIKKVIKELKKVNKKSVSTGNIPKNIQSEEPISSILMCMKKIKKRNTLHKNVNCLVAQKVSDTKKLKNKQMKKNNQCLKQLQLCPKSESVQNLIGIESRLIGKKKYVEVVKLYGTNKIQRYVKEVNTSSASMEVMDRLDELKTNGRMVFDGISDDPTSYIESGLVEVDELRLMSEFSDFLEKIISDDENKFPNTSLSPESNSEMGRAMWLFSVMKN